VLLNLHNAAAEIPSARLQISAGKDAKSVRAGSYANRSGLRSASRLSLTAVKLYFYISGFTFMIITFASSKGGVGKSTATASIAGAFAKAGLNVHIIDLDSNKTVSRWFADKKTRPRNITVSTPDPEKLTEHLQEVAVKQGPDIILIDVAGTYERALTHAIARAHLTIIPAGTSEADIYEAGRVAQHLRQVFAAFNRKPLYRLLLTRIQPIVSHAQRHAYGEINRLKLPLFRSLLAHRAAYEEIGLSGLPPHFADQKRETVAKAVNELDALKEEIEVIIGLKADGKAVSALRKAQA